MIKVALPCGRFALIDDDALPLLNGRNWYSCRRDQTYYVVGRLPGERRTGVLLHNLIMGCRGIDHKDRDGLNNQRSNLRPCTQQKNRMNTTPKVGKLFKGVYPARGKWYASIGVGRIYTYSRGHLTAESAARAYDEMAIRLHGEFARLNFPMLDRSDARQGELLGAS